MHVKEDPRSKFQDLPFVEFLFDENHPLMRLCAAIDWDNLLERLGVFYSQDKGRPSIALRAQAGTLMIKSLKNLPDREAVSYVEENIYAQRFCGLHPSQAASYMSKETGLTNFRIKIRPEGMALIEEALTSAAMGKSLKRGDNLIVDTTCVALDIHYPTDIRLLERCRREILRLFKEAKGMGLEVLYRTYNRTARKVFVRFSKLSKPKQKTRRRVHKQMFQFTRRNLKQLADFRHQVARELGSKVRSNPQLRGFLKTLKETELRIRTIIHQQKLVRRGIVHIPNRIVSFHKDHVRPIVRGKFPLSTEFGPKVLLAIFRGCMYRVAAFQDNVADALMITRALRWCKEKFKRLPKKLLGDRGFYARWRVRCLKTAGIIPGLQQRGKAVEVSPAQRRMNRQRLAIEARISLAKRKFGLSRCRARIDEHESSWIGLGVAAMNAHVAYYCDTS